MTTERITTLLVDDHAGLRALYRTTLEEAGDFDIVGEAGNGARCIELAAALAPRLIVLDLSMPGMDGLETLAVLRASHPSTHVVVLSGFPDANLAAVTRTLGATAYVEKGIHLGGLADRLREALREAPPPAGRPSDEELARCKDLI